MFNCVQSNTHMHIQEVVGVNGFWSEESNTVLSKAQSHTHNPITIGLMDRFWTRMCDLAHLKMRVFATIYFNCQYFRL